LNRSQQKIARDQVSQQEKNTRRLKASLRENTGLKRAQGNARVKNAQAKKGSQSVTTQRGTGGTTVTAQKPGFFVRKHFTEGKKAPKTGHGSPSKKGIRGEDSASASIVSSYAEEFIHKTGERATLMRGRKSNAQALVGYKKDKREVQC